MKTFIGSVLSLCSYQMVTIDEKSKKEYDFAFEVNWQETGARTTKITVTTYKYLLGGFDIRLFHKGVSGDIEINGWKFPGFFSGTYEDKGEYGWKTYASIPIIDPKGNSKSVGIGGENGAGPMCFYSSVALNYLEKIFDFSMYKDIQEHELATSPKSSHLLQSSHSSPQELLEQLTILQMMAESVRNLDNIEDIPEHIKVTARKKYQSLLTRIKKSADFELIIDKLLGFDFCQK